MPFRLSALIAILVTTACSGGMKTRPAKSTSTFTPRADAFVYEGRRHSNYGTSFLRTDGRDGVRVESYLRFDVNGVVGRITSAKLRLYATKDRSSRGPAVYGTGNDWSESTITWSNRPAATRTATRARGAIGSGSWVEFDVTRLVKGNGTYSFVLAQTSTDGVNFSSRERKQKPELVLTVDDTEPGTGSLASLLPPRLPRSSGRNYYVGNTGDDTTGDGSLTNPWRTIQKALDSVPTSGSLINLRGGTYATDSTWRRNGDPRNPVTIQSYPRERATISVRLRVYNGSNFRIQNLEFTSAASNTVPATPLWVQSSSNVELYHNHCHDSVQSCILVSGVGGPSRNVQVIRNLAERAGRGQLGVPHTTGIYYGSGGTSGGAVYDNVSYANGRMGIQLYSGADGVIVANNTSSGNGQDGINLGGSTNTSTDHALIVNNLTTNNGTSAWGGGYGIRVDWEGTPGSGNAARHNLSYGNASGNFERDVGITFAGNITGRDPLYVDEPAANLRLETGSPAIGLAEAAYAPLIDFDGNVRDRSPDLGAFER